MTISVQELKQVAKNIGADWRLSAVQTGYMDGKRGREKTALTYPKIKHWRDTYEKAYALGRENMPCSE